MFFSERGLAICAALALIASHATASPTLRAASEALSDGARAALARSVRGPSGISATAAWLHPHLDRTRERVGAGRALDRAGVALTGRGVVVGLVDTGVDLAHPDLRDTSGGTRVAWMLDYARAPTGLHPELEARFTINAGDGRRGAVYDRDELDAMLREGRAPGDPVGHGTHALSIALGTGGAERRYVGMAPEASAVVVRASLREDRAEVPETAALLGAAFVFDRADAMRAPAVVTLSLGTHHGAHDGDSALERGLRELVRGGDAPARALVVSAGNGGARRVHARVELTRGTMVPLSVRVAGVGGVTIAYSRWLAVRARWPDGLEGERVLAGFVGASRHPGDGSVVSVANAMEGASPVTGARVADTLFEGARGVYELELEGEGRVDAWVFAGEQTELVGTYVDVASSVEVPATSEAVIAVGALGQRDEVAMFSARGPSRAWALKPDLVAPGELVVAALSAQAALTAGSVFADPALAVDETHAVASGTSAAAPHVAGAIALLFEESPTATQRELMTALAAGDAPWDAARGWSALDVPRALGAMRASDPMATASRGRSACALSVGEVVRGERVVVTCRVLDAGGAPTRGSVTLAASAGRVEPTAYLGAGRYTIGYVAPEVGARVVLSVALEGAPLTRWTVALSAGPGTRGAIAAGGCSVVGGRARRGGRDLAMVIAACAMARARRRRRPGSASTSARPHVRSAPSASTT